MINRDYWLLILFSLFLSACSAIEKEQPVNYYVLDAKPSEPLQKDIVSNYLVERIELPDYLNQPNIVLRDESQRLHLAFYHSWADDLASTIRRVVISQLNLAQNTARFTSQCENCNTLSLSLDHFYPTTQGEVVLSGNYRLVKLKGQPLSQNFYISVDLTEDGYEHAVKKMRLALVQLTQMINKDINAISQR